MNVLVTSGGRRGSLVEAFGIAAHARSAKVFVSDISSLAPALYLADTGLQSLRADDPGYVDQLLTLIDQHRIGLLAPTLDTELAPLSKAAPRFAEHGCLALISEPDFVLMTGNKWRTYEFCVAEGIPTHRSWLPSNRLPEDLPERLFVKPCEGSASAHTYRATRENLATILDRVPDPIVQEEAEGAEVTVDALLSNEGELIHFVPRRRIRHLAGESIIGVTLDDPALDEWIEQVLQTCGRRGARGPITMQCFQTPRGPLLTEINPRFGGGFPLTNRAGGHYPEWCVQIAEGKPQPPRIGEYQRGLYMTRYYSEIYFTEPKWNP